MGKTKFETYMEIYCRVQLFSPSAVLGGRSEHAKLMLVSNESKGKPKELIESVLKMYNIYSRYYCCYGPISYCDRANERPEYKQELVRYNQINAEFRDLIIKEAYKDGLFWYKEVADLATKRLRRYESDLRSGRLSQEQLRATAQKVEYIKYSMDNTGRIVTLFQK